MKRFKDSREGEKGRVHEVLPWEWAFPGDKEVGGKDDEQEIRKKGQLEALQREESVGGKENSNGVRTYS